MINDYFHSSDLGLAASLSAVGFDLARVDKTNPRRVVFYFANSPELERATKQYLSGDLKLSAAVLMEHIKMLKGRIYTP